ncbi:MAG: hypothetical protein HQK81_06765 [Desulfovibrionaceae bacterium]|nr:hypothetical protein [Desulfovibrionaceae bacterium]MBF0513752.1 hypothetical protein [Desulfovibrionaceae bacterium]
MSLSERERQILKNVRFFSRMHRYGGMMPAKYLLLYENDDLGRLIAADYLERVVLSTPSNTDYPGLRLGRAGAKLINEEEAPVIRDGNQDIPVELVEIMEDIHHFSRIGRYRGLMPEKKARQYEASDLEDLLNNGYVYKVKTRSPGGKKNEGYVISTKTHHLLKKLRII